MKVINFLKPAKIIREYKEGKIPDKFLVFVRALFIFNILSIPLNVIFAPTASANRFYDFVDVNISTFSLIAIIFLIYKYKIDVKNDSGFFTSLSLLGIVSLAWIIAITPFILIFIFIPVVILGKYVLITREINDFLVFTIDIIFIVINLWVAIVGVREFVKYKSEIKNNSLKNKNIK